MKKLWIGILLTALCYGCTKEVPEQVSLRTLVVYIAYDNDLSGELTAKIAALEQAATTSMPGNCRMVIYADGRGETPRLIGIGPNGSRTEKNYPGQNSASPGVLSRVLDDAAALYPARSYGLIVCSHATGWLPKGALDNPGGFLCEGETRTILADGESEMEIGDFVGALPDGRFDFIVFENCYMADAAALYALRHKTPWIVASAAEVLSPGFRDIYRTSLGCLFAATPDLETFAADYFRYRSFRPEPMACSATVSVIRTSSLERLADVAGRIVRTCGKRFTVEELASIQHFNRGEYPFFFDQDDYVSRCASREDYAQFRQVLEQTVVYCDATPCFMEGDRYGFRIGRHCGLTVYIPVGRFPGLDRCYSKQEWGRLFIP